MIFSSRRLDELTVLPRLLPLNVMTLPTSETPNCHDSGFWRCLRWVMVLFLIFDFLSSPWHTHAHALIEGVAVHAWENEAVTGSDDRTSAEDHHIGFEAPTASHSMLALVPHDLRGTALPEVVVTVLVLSLFATWLHASTPRRGWPAVSRPRPVSPGRYRRPISRAPPQLHR